MKKFVLGALALASVAMSVPAQAADMPVKAAPPPPPVCLWNGWYVGVNAGYAQQWDDNVDVLETDSAFAGPGVFVFAGRFGTLRAAGGFAGAQWGFNWCA